MTQFRRTPRLQARDIPFEPGRRATTRELLERAHPTVDSPTYRKLAGLDPDPRYVPEGDERLPNWEHQRRRAIDQAGGLGPTASCLLVALSVLVVVAILIAQLLAAPHGASAGSEPAGDAPSSPAVANVATSGGPSGLTASMPASISGPATWYDAPSIHDAAAGPRLRKALGRDWRGSLMQVCGKSSCITVILSDWCACGHGRVIDLDDRAFARLAPLSQGIVRVSIEQVGAIGEPATATAPPTDVE